MMKKLLFNIIISTCLILALSNTLRGVTLSAVGLGGLNIAMQNQDPNSDYVINMLKFGYLAGGGLDLELLPLAPIALEVDVMYEQRGDSRYISLEKEPSYVNIWWKDRVAYANKLCYLTIPIIVKYVRRSRNRRFAIYGGLGPSIHTILSARSELNFIVDGESFEFSYELDDDEIKLLYKKTDVGIIGTFGVELNHYLLEVRIDMGMQSIYKEDIPGISMKNNSACLMGGIKF